MPDAIRPGDFSDAEDALRLLADCRDSSPESLQVHITLSPRVMYISWPNKDYQPDDGSSPFHCACLYLAEDNVVAKAMGAGRNPFSPIDEASDD